MKNKNKKLISPVKFNNFEYIPNSFTINRLTTGRTNLFTLIKKLSIDNKFSNMLAKYAQNANLILPNASEQKITIGNTIIPFHFLYNIKNENVQIALINNPTLPISKFPLFVKSNNKNVKINLATNKRTPPIVLDQLSNEHDLEILVVLTQNTNLPTIALDKITKVVQKPRPIFGIVEGILINTILENIAVHPNTLIDTTIKIVKTKQFRNNRNKILLQKIEHNKMQITNFQKLQIAFMRLGNELQKLHYHKI